MSQSQIENLNAVPTGWIWTTFKEILDIQGGSQPPKETFLYEPKEGYVQLLQIRDFGAQTVPTYVPIDSVTKFCQKEDVMIARYGASLGRILIGLEGAYNVALVKVLFDHNLISNKYVFYLLQTPLFQTPIHMISRSAQNGFNKSEIFPIVLPLAPLAEQRRIVAAIETHFTRLDTAVATLHRLQANLKRYRAAVLKAACEGRLVPQDPTDEPATQLLARILAERRSKWQAANPGKKYQEPTPPDTSGLSELPEGWVWGSVNEISQFMQYGTSDKAEVEWSGAPVIRMGNIQEGKLDFTNLKFMPEGWSNLAAYELTDGDLLFNRTNSAELVGKTAVYKRHHLQAVFASYLIRVRVAAEFLPNFLSFYINSVFGRQYIASVVSQQVGQANVNGTKLANMPVPIPPLAEQQRIVAEVERRLSVIDQHEKAIRANLARAARLRQSILKRAFTGRLVPQDPADEPAANLLERIKATRTGKAKSQQMKLEGV